MYKYNAPILFVLQQHTQGIIYIATLLPFEDFAAPRFHVHQRAVPLPLSPQERVQFGPGMPVVFGLERVYNGPELLVGNAFPHRILLVHPFRVVEKLVYGALIKHEATKHLEERY